MVSLYANSNVRLYLHSSNAPPHGCICLMGALLLSRLLHPLGMYAAPNTLQFRIGRVGGITITLALLLACALTILWRALFGA